MVRLVNCDVQEYNNNYFFHIPMKHILNGNLLQQYKHTIITTSQCENPKMQGFKNCKITKLGNSNKFRIPTRYVTDNNIDKDKTYTVVTISEE